MKPLKTICLYFIAACVFFLSGHTSPKQATSYVSAAADGCLAPKLQLAPTQNLRGKITGLLNAYKQSRNPEVLREFILLLNYYIQPALYRASAYPCINMSNERNADGLFYGIDPIWLSHYPVSCFISSSMVEQIVPVLMPEMKVYRITLSTQMDKKRMTHHVSLLYDTKTQRYFYLSFTDGQFVPAPEEMKKVQSALRADNSDMVRVSTKEYIRWYVEQGLGTADFFEIDFRPEQNDGVNDLCDKLEAAISEKTDLNGHFNAILFIEEVAYQTNPRLLAYIEPDIKTFLMELLELEQKLRAAA